MKVNSISNNQSFGALMLERKKATPEQKKIIKAAVQTVIDDSYYVTLLESRYTDIYISPNKDKKSVDLKLLSAAGFSYNYVPKDKKGELKVNLHVPDSSFREGKEERLAGNIKVRTKNFLKRSIDCIFDSINSKENEAEKYELENLSYSDLVHNRISHPEMMPKALCLYGEPQVTTK